MDPSLFLQYSPPTGLPQESKLATYMSHTYTPPAVMRPLTQALSNISLDRSPAPVQKDVIAEYIPAYFNPIVPEVVEPVAPLISHQTQQVHQENVGGTTYFLYSTNTETLNASVPSANLVPAEPMLHVGQGASLAAAYGPHVYAPHHSHPLTFNPLSLESYYSPETIRAEIYQRNESLFLQSDLRHYPDLPENVEMYTDLLPLEGAPPHSLATGFRATHRHTAGLYAMRRLHNYNLIPNSRLDLWKDIDHPNVARLHEYFVSKTFRDRSLIMVYTYHPGAMTLMSKYLMSAGGNAMKDHDPFSSDPDAPRPYTHQKNTMLRAVASGAMMPEPVIWSIMVQLSSALRVIHAAGLACGTLDPTKVITNGCRVRIAWCGGIDAIHGAPNDIGQAQQEDLTALGRLAMSLACRTINCDNLAACMDIISRTYSSDLKNFILYLISGNPGRRTVADLMPMIGARFYTQVEVMQKRVDTLEDEFAHEVDNGRLLRLLIKLGTVNERPELNMDPSWSETGGRYMLKLFRDYLFHSVSPDGRPFVDQAHLTYSLNELDRGARTKVVLTSRDDESVLVVTYAELKSCLEQAFDEVMKASDTPLYTTFTETQPGQN